MLLSLYFIVGIWSRVFRDVAIDMMITFEDAVKQQAPWTLIERDRETQPVKNDSYKKRFSLADSKLGFRRFVTVNCPVYRMTQYGLKTSPEIWFPRSDGSVEGCVTPTFPAIVSAGHLQYYSSSCHHHIDSRTRDGMWDSERQVTRKSTRGIFVWKYIYISRHQVTGCLRFGMVRLSL